MRCAFQIGSFSKVNQQHYVLQCCVQFGLSREESLARLVYIYCAVCVAEAYRERRVETRKQAKQCSRKVEISFEFLC